MHCHPHDARSCKHPTDPAEANAVSLCSASASKPVAIKQAIQPRSPAEVVSIDEPQVSQTRAFLLITAIAIPSLCDHYLAEMAQLFIHVARIDNRAADFFSQNRPVPRTQACHINSQMYSGTSDPNR